jgi:hypothetical protein
VYEFNLCLLLSFFVLLLVEQFVVLKSEVREWDEIMGMMQLRMMMCLGFWNSIIFHIECNFNLLVFCLQFFCTCGYDFYDNMSPKMRSIFGYLFSPSIHGTESVYGNIVHAAFSMALKKIPHMFICNSKDIES